MAGHPAVLRRSVQCSVGEQAIAGSAKVVDMQRSLEAYVNILTECPTGFIEIEVPLGKVTERVAVDMAR